MGTAIFEGIPLTRVHQSHHQKFITAAKAALDNMVDARFCLWQRGEPRLSVQPPCGGSQGKIRMNFIDAEHLKDCRVEGEPDPELQLLRIEDLSESRWLCWSTMRSTTMPTSTTAPATRQISPALAQASPQAVRRGHGGALYAQRLRRHQLIDLDRLDFATATTSTTGSACLMPERSPPSTQTSPVRPAPSAL